MLEILKLIIGVKFKILSRNDFGKTKKIKTWTVLIVQFLFLFFLAYQFKSISVVFLLPIFLLISILNSHSIDDKSWLDSNFLYPIFTESRMNILINCMSDLIMKFLFIVPFLFIIDYSKSLIELLLIAICILFNIFLGFFLSELSFKEIKYKKGSKTLLILNIALFAFITSGALDFQGLTINTNTMFLSFIKKYSTEGLLLLSLLHLIVLILFRSLYFKKYHHQVNGI